MTTTLYLGNLPDTVSDEEISALCTRNGLAVKAVRRSRDRATGRARGFAFVDLESEVEAGKALAALDGAELLGRRLTVQSVGPQREPRAR